MPFDRVVVLTGSGISAESGIATFRDTTGIWAKFDYREVATPEGFMRNPELVHEFYNMRVRSAAGVKPNAAHVALARFEQQHGARPGCSFALVTQNVDPLHEMAGSVNVIHMHGEMAKVLCARCGRRHARTRELSTLLVCPACGEAGGLRPDVVWFGEMPYHMERIGGLLAQADLFISFRTSGTVYPAAGLVAEPRAAGAHTVELNLEPSEGASLFAEAVHGKASEVVPAYIARLLDGA